MMWATSTMICDFCLRKWVSVHPAKAEQLECPDCHKMNRVPVA